MPNETVLPTAERLTHGSVEQLDRLTDDAGRAARPHRAIDILASMEAKGTITPQMRLAGADFRMEFRAAFKGDLRSSDLSKPFVSGTQVNGYRVGSTDKRESVYKVLDTVGGPSSQAGSILWHVIGLEWSIKSWAQMYSAARLRRISEETASGILVGALCPLVRLYGYE